MTVAMLSFLSNSQSKNDTGQVPMYDTVACQLSSKTVPANKLGLAVLSIAEPEALEKIDELGVQMIRFEFRWDQIEAQEGIFNWEEYDESVAALADRGVEIFATLNHPPVWAHEVSVSAPSFQAFLQTFIARYGEHISYYEIFNEPNLQGYGWPFGKDDIAYNANLYASILVSANQTIRSLDTEAFIVSAGLSPDGQDYQEFTKKLHEHISGDCYDIFSFHPYGRGDILVETQSEIKALLSELGVADKPVWFAEFGTSDEELLVPTIKQVSEQIKELDGLIWFSLRDLKARGWNFGLVEYDWSEKPAYGEFKQLVEQHNNRDR